LLGVCLSLMNMPGHISGLMAGYVTFIDPAI
jgi:hypothetical protein